MQDILLSAIQESPTNPRRQFDETKLAELADNIRRHAVLQPCSSARCRILAAEVRAELTGVKKKVKKRSGIAAAKAAERK